jgi:transposase
MEKINLTQAEREQLLTMQRNVKLSSRIVKRARLILMLSEGVSRGSIKRRLGCDPRYISTWQDRFLKERVKGLHNWYMGSAPRDHISDVEAKVLDYTFERQPADGSQQWTCYKLAAELGLTFLRVQRTWHKYKIQGYQDRV